MIKQNYITYSFLFSPIKELSHSSEIILPEFDVLGDNVETRTNEDIQLGATICGSDVTCPKKAIITPTGTCSTFIPCVEDTNCPNNVYCPANMIPCGDFCVEDFDYVEGTLYYKYFEIFSDTSGQPITWLSDSNISDEWDEGVYLNFRTDAITSAETRIVLNKCMDSNNKYLLTTLTNLNLKIYTMFVNCHLAFSGLTFSLDEYTVTASTESEVRSKLLGKEYQLMTNYDGSPLEQVVLTPISITIKTDESSITTGNKINRSQTINGTKLTVYNSNNTDLTNNNFIKGDTIIYNFGTSEMPFVKNIIRFKCPFRYIIIKRSRPGYEFDDIVYTINTLYENSYIYINDENGYDITKTGNVTPTNKIATVDDFKTMYPNALYGFTFFIDKTVFENGNTCLNPSMSSDDKDYFDQYNTLPYMTTELIRIQDLNGIKSSVRILSNFLGESISNSLLVHSTLPNNISMSGTISGNNIQY